MSDDEIQERLQRNESVSGPEASTYRKIFAALGREPQFVLPPSFADSVIRQLVIAPSKSRDVLWFVTGLATCFIVLVVAIWQIGYVPVLRMPGFLRDYIGLIVFGAAVAMMLHFVDRRLLRKAA